MKERSQTPRRRSLARVLGKLRKCYGRPTPFPVTGPFELILLENVAYLADDRRRWEALEILRERTGLDPRRILTASDATLLEVGRRGILPAGSAGKLREAARIALEEFAGDLDAAVRRLPPREAAKALRRFPSIGEPGAERILVFAGRLRALGLDSNGLRALRRIGYGEQKKSYVATYRSVQTAAAPELPRGPARLIEASWLLRRHGQELCKTNHPLCDACPLRQNCLYYRGISARL